MKKILIIRFSSIGDIVLTTPVIRSLKKNYPDAEIHYLTKTGNHQVLQANPNITKFWLYENDLPAMISQLRKENFDFVADLHKSLRSRYVVARLNRPSSTFPKLNARKWLLIQAKINTLPPVHIVDRYFQAVKVLGVRNDGKGLDFFISPEDEIMTDTLPVPFNHGYNALVIGGKHVTKLLPEEKIAEICNGLILPVILLGGTEDFSRGESIVSMCRRNVLNTCGKYNLGQSASILKNAANVITHDTGLMHIAAAFRKTVVSIWGNTIPGFGMYPYYPGNETPLSMISEVKGLSCRPCSKIGYEKCPLVHFRCMTEQDTGKIIEFVNEIK